MNARKLRLTVAAMLLSLLGLASVQVSWLKVAVELSEQEFRHSVNEGIAAVVHTLEEKESTDLYSKDLALPAEPFAAKKQSPSPSEPNRSEDSLSLPVEKTADPVVVKPSQKNTPAENAAKRESKAVSSTSPTINTRLAYFSNSSSTKQGIFDSMEVFEVQNWESEQQHEVRISGYSDEGDEENVIVEQQYMGEDEGLEQPEKKITLMVRKMPAPVVSKTNERNEPKSEWHWRDSALRVVLRDKNKIATQVYCQLAEKLPQSQLEKVVYGQNLSNEILRERKALERAKRRNGSDFQSSFVLTSSRDNNSEPRVVSRGNKLSNTIFVNAREIQTNGLRLYADNTRAFVFSPQNIHKEVPDVNKPIILTRQKIAESAPTVKNAQNVRLRRDGESAHKKPKMSVQTVVNKVDQITDVAAKWLSEMTLGRRNIHGRIKLPLVYEMLKKEFAQRGIFEDFSLEVLCDEQNSVEMRGGQKNIIPVRHATFGSSLFPNDILPSEYSLKVYFAGINRWNIENMWLQILASGIFAAIILTTFGMTVFAMNKQKKLSDLKTEFINNMTHEFQTPISTISLASEALREEIVLQNSERRTKFLSVIYEENKRLGKNVELLLQAATLENDHYAIKSEQVDIHAILLSESNNAAMLAEQRGGNVYCRLRATQSAMSGDPTHLSNIFRNILENANKYSPDAPEIIISTENIQRGIVIRISDNGRGMTKEQTSRIFDRFYRVPTGNRHDVKGFGLGLSYVKSLAERHNGVVSVESALGKGSCFSIYFPLETL